MKQKELETNLQSLDKYDLYLILWFVRLRWLRHKASLLQPVHLLIPATFLQIIVFIISAFNPERFIPNIAIGNLLIVGIALLPSTFPRPIKAHWIRS